MAVLIKGMEMPKCCSDCEIEIYNPQYLRFYCPLVGHFVDFVRTTSKLDKCPLREINEQEKEHDIADIAYDYDGYRASKKCETSQLMELIDAIRGLPEVKDD